VPWFVAWEDGVPDFRVVAPGNIRDAVRFGLCWVCGQPAGQYKAFVLGPMCAVNRVSSEPPSHRDCAVYSATHCPFLATPGMRRREPGGPAGTRPPPGLMITRNPGVALVWVTRSYRLQRVPGGVLFEIGDPLEVLWFAQGRPATRAEVDASIETGLPALREQAERDGPGATRLLDAAVAAVAPLLPVA
jgi:hypothetical protein